MTEFSIALFYIKDGLTGMDSRAFQLTQLTDYFLVVEEALDAHFGRFLKWGVYHFHL